MLLSAPPHPSSTQRDHALRSADRSLADVAAQSSALAAQLSSAQGRVASLEMERAALQAAAAESQSTAEVRVQLCTGPEPRETCCSWALPVPFFSIETLHCPM